MPNISNECKTLLERLKGCDTEEMEQNPSLMLRFYPIRRPDCETTVFDEVYCLLGGNFLRKSYRFKLIFFLNTFLSSTKVPAYIIAAYIKKLSRFTLNAKPRTLVSILKLVGNLILRHPILLVLRDRVDDKAQELSQESDSCTLRQWLLNDPFNNDLTTDLKATRAMESSVWELMPLRFHKHPKVANAASFLNNPKIPEMEFDINPCGRYQT